MGRKKWVILALMVPAVAGVAAWKVTHVTLTSGDGREGGWRLEASWTPKEYCLRVLRETGEGGACAYTLPPTLNEVVSWRVYRGQEVLTLAGGPVVDEAERVEIEPSDGPTVEAELRKVVGLTFFFAEMPGVQALESVVAYDADGGAIDQLEHTPYPPPSPSSGPPRPERLRRRIDAITFPEQRSGGPFMQALLKGNLIEDDGCLYVAFRDEAKKVLPIWRAGSSLVTDGYGIEVRDENGAVIGRVGERVSMGGGMFGEDGGGPPRPLKQGTGDCEGPYWIVGQADPLRE